MVGIAMRRVGLDKYMAEALLRIVGGSGPTILLLTIMTFTMMLSVVMSAVACSVVMCGVGEQMINAMKEEISNTDDAKNKPYDKLLDGQGDDDAEDDDMDVRPLLERIGEGMFFRKEGKDLHAKLAVFAKGLLIAIPYSSTLGGLMSKNGTGQNLVFQRIYAAETGGLEVDWGRWFLYALPTSLIMLIVLWRMFTYLFLAPELKALTTSRDPDLALFKPLSRSQACTPLYPPPPPKKKGWGGSPLSSIPLLNI
jgi:di/tricarboxylate transporter